MKKANNGKACRDRKLSLTVISLIVLNVGILCFFSARWYITIYGDIGFDSIIYTLFSAMNGVQTSLIGNYIVSGLSFAVLFGLLISLFLFFIPKHKIVVKLFNKHEIKIYPFNRIVSSVISILLSVILIFQAANMVGLVEYISDISQKSTFYQEEYVDPDSVNITFPKEKRNLIYIFLESMETTYLSSELGGAIDKNLIPELYELAENNINFSHNESVGGFSAITGSTWTMGAMVSQTAGIPLKVPSGFSVNEFGEAGDTLLPGVTTLNDILHANGYYQTLMVGSDSVFGGRKYYFDQHGVDKIYDLYTAREDGLIPEDYFEWWGFEDSYLFEYAKQELTEIASNSQPFAFTMLTVDTHHIDGYFCEKCENTYDEQYENVISCSSRQVYEFVEWIKQQDFYEDTSIVIVGDHPTMDYEYIERNVADGYSRHVYNCFINSSASSKNTNNRLFSTTDIFPTVLASIGCLIEGDRLGLGTNLFSDVPTLSEKMGYLEFDEASSRYSDYYMKNFYFN